MAKPKKPTTRCPCGSGSTFGECCGPLLRRQRTADTAEQLMRSRYTAFVRKNAAYLDYSRHPDTASNAVGEMPDGSWAPLEVLVTKRGLAPDTTGEVEFRASYSHGDHHHTVHEVSTFGRVEGRWVYVDGNSTTEPG